MSNTVTVLCAIRHGLTCELGLVYDPDRMCFHKGPNYKSVTLKGGYSTLLTGQPNQAQLAPGVTENVDAEFMEAWLHQNAALGFVKEGLIKIVRPSDVKAVSRDLKQVRTGAEPLDPNAMPKRLERVLRDTPQE